MKKADKIRFHLTAADSPTTFSSFHLQGASNGVYSPMTELSMNLNDATLANSPIAGVTPRRRLSLSVSDGTPTPNRCNVFKLDDRHSAMDYDYTTCDKENGLLKNAIKFPGLRGSTFSRGPFRRMPADEPPRPLDKENHRDAVDATAVPCVVTPSPVKCLLSPSKFAMMRQQKESPRHRQPLEDHDPNSQDSGYGNSQGEAKIDPKTGFRFAEPFGLAPRRQLSDQSPMKENSSLSPRTKSGCALFRNLSSSSSSGADDGFTELYDAESADSSESLPAGLGSLLNKPILTDETSTSTARHTCITTITSVTTVTSLAVQRAPRPSLRRSFSLVDSTTPNLSRARSCLFKPPSALGSPMQQDEVFEASRAFKRPSVPSDEAGQEAKRSRGRTVLTMHSVSESVIATTTQETLKKQTIVLKRSFSETQATIMKALHRSTTEPDLIGDFTLPYALPLIEGRHQDLKTISADTLARLMAGAFSDRVEAFTIIDCRYPYEFDGGHIRGARNVFTKEQVSRDFVEDAAAMATRAAAAAAAAGNGAKRKHIIVFHCEFSSERGPNLYRFLRNSDRAKNKECYPALFHPEMYLLEGGYKRFFETHPPLCEPCDYRPMLDPGHEHDLRHFRAKSKSWTGDGKSRLALRSGLKRLGL